MGDSVAKHRRRRIDFFPLSALFSVKYFNVVADVLIFDV